MLQSLISKHSPLIFSLLLFLILQSQVFNFTISFRDEGFLNYNAIRIINGEIPYKDFFLTTSPGTFYIQALLIKTFGEYLLVGRIFYVFIIVLILFLANRLFNLNKTSKFVFLSALALIFTGPSYAFYNIEGLVLILLSLLLYKQKGNRWIFLLGFVSGLIFYVKQSYGGFITLVYTILLITSSPKSSRGKHLFLFFSGLSIPIVIFFTYFYFTGALNNMFYYLFQFSSKVKSHRLPFIITTVIFSPLFIIAIITLKKLNLKKASIYSPLFFILAFISYLALFPERINRLTTIIFDPLIYYYVLLLVVPLTTLAFFFIKKDNISKELALIASLSLGIFLASASSGRDYTTVLILSPTFIPLCYLLIVEVLSKRMSNIKKNVVFFCLVILYIIPFIPHLISNLSMSINKDDFSTTKHVKSLTLINIPEQQLIDIVKTINFIRQESSADDKIFCFPYCPMIFFLAQRDSASFFSFYYPETFIQKDQDYVIKEIMENKTNIAVIQRKGIIEKEADFENKRLSALKSFITKNFYPVFRSENFEVYRKDLNSK